MSKVGTRLIKAAKEARAIARGELTDSFVVQVPDNVDVKALRRKLKCSQAEFSRRFGFAIDAVQDWDIGERRTERPGFF
jgi:putative transcriptional regulator